MELTRKQRWIGGAAGLVVVAIGGGLLLADFAQTDYFDYYKQDRASAYQAPGALVAATPVPVQPPPAPRRVAAATAPELPAASAHGVPVEEPVAEEVARFESDAAAENAAGEEIPEEPVDDE